MASSSSGIIRALLVIVFVGIVFYGINWLLEPVSDGDEQVISTPGAEFANDSDGSSQTDMTAAEAEAQRYGAEIGRRVGTEIGRQVGLAAVAGLQAAGVEPGTVQAATEDEEVDEMEEAAPVVAAKPEPAPEPKPAPVVAAKPKSEPKPEPVVAAKPQPEPAAEPVEAAAAAEPVAEPVEATAAAAEPVAQPTPEVAMQSSNSEPEVEAEAEETEPAVKKNLRRWLPNRTSARP